MNSCSNWPGSSFRMTLNRLSMNLNCSEIPVDVAKIKGKFRFIHHIDWSFINYTNEGKMSTIALNNTLMSRMKIGPRF